MEVAREGLWVLDRTAEELVCEDRYGGRELHLCAADRNLGAGFKESARGWSGCRFVLCLRGQCARTYRPNDDLLGTERVVTNLRETVMLS